MRVRQARAVVALLRKGWQPITFCLLLVAATALHLSNLNHTYLAPWDEAIHAVVAEHLALHPLQPTLYEAAVLSSQLPGGASWEGYAHIWLHIPPLGLWAAALSMRFLGYTPFALRLPGVVFVALGMGVTYELGRRLFGSVVGLVGAAFIGFAPYPLLISQGYAFGDVTDTPLLLLTPLTVLCLVAAYRSGRLRWLIGAGAAQGLCYLTKGGLGLAPVAVAMALYAAEWIFPPEAGWKRLGLRGLALFLAVTVAVAAPYNIYLATTFPAAYAVEGRNWIQAFFTNYEGWGRPPDYHVTIYLFAMYGSALALLLVSAVITLGVVALRRRSRAELVVVVWVGALYLPLSLAVTKAVPMTLPAVPALGLAVGQFSVLGLQSHWARRRGAALGVLVATASASILILASDMIQSRVHLDMSYHHPSILLFLPPPILLRLAPYLLEAGCVILAVGAPEVMFAISRDRRSLADQLYAGNELSIGQRKTRAQSRVSAGSEPPGRRERLATHWALVLVVLVLATYWMHSDLQSAGQTFGPSPAAALGALVQEHAPANATILITRDTFDVADTPVMNARIMVMFWAHRDVYAITSTASADICPLVAHAASVGSPTLLLTDQPFVGDALGTSAGWTLYRPRCA